MVSKEIKIIDKAGLHIRPASVISKLSKELSSEHGDKCILSYNGKDADMSSILKLMSLAVKPNSIVKISVDGPSEQKSLDAIISKLKSTKLAE